MIFMCVHTCTCTCRYIKYHYAPFVLEYLTVDLSVNRFTSFLTAADLYTSYMQMFTLITGDYVYSPSLHSGKFEELQYRTSILTVSIVQ